MSKHGNQLSFALGAIGAVGAVAGTFAATHAKQKTARKECKHVPHGPYEALFKRPLDAVTAASALVVLSPVLAATAIQVRKKLGNPALFMQKRPGQNGDLFNIFKFRTMTNETDEEGNLLPDSERLTDLGRLLRSTSIDELPELYNVLKGDMSLVGPRPLLEEYMPYYTVEEARRHDVRPGITGLSQINGRNHLNWDDRFKLDVEYVDNITFLGDLTILVKTVGKVVRRLDVAEKRVTPLDAARKERQ